MGDICGKREEPYEKDNFGEDRVDSGLKGLIEISGMIQICISGEKGPSEETEGEGGVGGSSDLIHGKGIGDIV